MTLKVIILAIVIMAIVTNAQIFPADKPCKYKGRFDYYCNDCVCEKSGFGARCSKMFCPYKMFNEDGSRVQYEESQGKREPIYDEEESSDEYSVERSEEVPHGIPVFPADKPCTRKGWFDYYCLSCKCEKSGFGAACSKENCGYDMFNEDGTRVEHEGSQFPGDSVEQPEGPPFEAIFNDVMNKEFPPEVPQGTPVFPADKPCTHEGWFDYYCLSCKCEKSGFGAACTRENCGFNMFNEDGTRVEYEGSQFHGEDSVDQPEEPSFAAMFNNVFNKGKEVGENAFSSMKKFGEYF